MKWVMRLCFIAFIFAYVGFGNVCDAHATDLKAAKWETTPIQILNTYEAEAPRYNGVPCSGNESKIVLEGNYTDESACIFGTSGQVRLARYLRGGEFRYAVSFVSDKYFYPVRGLCENIARCIYSPNSDALLMSNVAYGVNFNTTLYYNFTTMLHRTTTAGATVFEFIAVGEGVVLGMDGRYFSTGTSAFSKNGRWAVVELHRYGIVRIEIETGRYRRVVAPGAEYGRGNDLTYELAISNSGELIAVVGLRLGLAVFRVTGNCGDVLNDASAYSFSSQAIECPEVEIDRYSLLPGFFVAQAPAFSGDDNVLSVIAQYQLGVRRVLLGPIGTRSPENTTQYVAFGDSYTSGEGELGDAFYLDGTNTSINTCHVSRRSYPLLLGQHWQVSSVNRACSGARMKDIFSNNGSILAQAARIEYEQPELVTIGIGGNDAGLMTKLKGCLGLDTCEWAVPGNSRAAVSTEMAGLFSPLVELVRSVKSAASQAKVVLVGYPEIISDSEASACDLLSAALLNKDERRFMGESIKYLNLVIASAARASGAAYIDIEDSLDGARLCDKGQAGMNGVRIGDDIALLPQLPKLKVIGAESFHPTPFGHQVISRSIVRSHDWAGLLGTHIAQNESVSVPAPGAYWQENSKVEPQAPELLNTEGIVAHEIKDGRLKVRLPPLIFAHGAEVVAEIHSKPVQLGSYITSANGSIAFTEELPDDISPGYHTVHLYGTSVSGEKVDAYFSLLIEKEDFESPPQSLVGEKNLVGHALVDSKQRSTPRDAPILDHADTASAVLGLIRINSTDDPPQQLQPAGLKPNKAGKWDITVWALFCIATIIILTSGVVIWLSLKKGRGG